jgi:hypothetical protein
MIDVRPLCVDVPLEIVFNGGSASAGIIDLSPDIGRDVAADRAIDSVIVERIYEEAKVEYFDFAYYWKTFQDMEEDLEENWKDEVVIPEEVWRRAHMLFNKRRVQTKIRVGVRMKLGIYEKQG